MAKRTNDDIFDPADQEIGPELVNAIETDESMFVPDTNGDPEGSEQRAKPDAIALPDYFFKKYMLDKESKPTFNPVRVEGIMKVFHSKKETPFNGPSTDEDQKQREIEAYEKQIDTIVAGQLALCDVDPQTTGINFLQLTTRTWGEFASIAYEFNEDASAANPNEDLPVWLIEREDKMFQLGRKARMLRDAVRKIDQRQPIRAQP